MIQTTTLVMIINRTCCKEMTERKGTLVCTHVHGAFSFSQAQPRGISEEDGSSSADAYTRPTPGRAPIRSLASR